MTDDRTALVKKQIFYSLLLKVLSIAITLIVIPLTLNYLDNARYGIWLTLSSLVASAVFFDIGITNGFRNKFAETIALGDDAKAQQYVSTTYALLTIIFIPLMFIICSLSFLVDWTALLHVEANLYELQMTFAIIFFFYCINFILNTLTIMLTADQRPAYSSFIITIGQAAALVAIFLLTRTATSSLVYLAVALSGAPLIIVILFTFIVFRSKRYKRFSPNTRTIDFSLTKNIIGLGSKFFFIMVFMLLIFQLINVIISRVEGAERVTEYNIAYKYFNVLLMFAMIILQPFWSSFTDAYTKKDFQWMKQVLKKLEIFGLLSIPVIIIMILCSNFAYDIWLDGAVKVDIMMTISVAFYFFCCIIANVYMVLINGTGKVFIQMIIYGIFAVLAFPLMYLLCETYNSSVMMLIPSLVYIVQAISGKIQLTKIIQNTDTGLWAK